MRLLGNRHLNLLSDALFPRRCISCGREGFNLCPDCADRLPLDYALYCPVCKNRSAGGITCNNCRSESSLDGLWSMSAYDDAIISRIVESVKYKFCTGVIDDLLKIFDAYFSQAALVLEKESILVPIPLHRRRFLWRGFNQAELLADAFARSLGRRVIADLLVRKINNPPQAKSRAEDRKRNIQGVFALNPGIVTDRNTQIVLVDDVYTTGSTMQEAAKTLKSGGFRHVRGLVLARG